MRMWGISPKLLCDKHLLGEHGEIHKHRHNFVKRHSITGRIFPVVQIEPSNMEKRHDQLAKEMLRRGMNHKSPYIQPDISYLPENILKVRVNRKANKIELFSRCDQCAKKGNQ